jgi:glycerophosphoryl diester phosphodiesterase
MRFLSSLFLAAFALSASAFDLEGHRGARGLAPENTLAAFRKALELGVTTIETDMAVTRDDVIVISHDPFLNPDLVRDPEGHWLTGKGPPVRTLTLAELRRYDVGRVNPASKYAQQFPKQRPADGERFPRLAELFALAKASGKPVRFNIETKITPTSGADTPDVATFARLVVAAVRAAGVTDGVTVESFDVSRRRSRRPASPCKRRATTRPATSIAPHRRGTPVLRFEITEVHCRQRSRRRDATCGRCSGAT